jgi:hypothetical protein
MRRINIVAAAARAHHPGEAVQLDPMKRMLKPPGTKRLKPESDILLSTAFNFCFQTQLAPLHPGCHVWLLTNEGTKTAGQGAYTRPLFSSK